MNLPNQPKNKLSHRFTIKRMFDFGCHVSTRLTPEVHQSLFRIFAAAGIKTTEDGPKFYCLTKAGEELFVLPYTDPSNGKAGLVWSHSPSNSNLSHELERIQFSSGDALLDSPDREIYVSTTGEVGFDQFAEKIRGQFSRAVFFGNWGSIDLPTGISLHFGPAADPETAAPRSYVSLSYSFVALRTRQRKRILAQLYFILSEMGLKRMPDRR